MLLLVRLKKYTFTLYDLHDKFFTFYITILTIITIINKNYKLFALQIYNPEKGRWVELGALDVMQMLGRAGRPQ